jgi:hypothetical protein
LKVAYWAGDIPDPVAEAIVTSMVMVMVATGAEEEDYSGSVSAAVVVDWEKSSPMSSPSDISIKDILSNLSSLLSLSFIG